MFLSLMLAFVLAAVFSLLEGARVWGLEKRVSTDAVQTGHSLMASIHRPSGKIIMYFFWMADMKKMCFLLQM